MFFRVYVCGSVSVFRCVMFLCVRLIVCVCFSMCIHAQTLVSC